MIMGLPLGRGTIYEVLGKVKWFGKWIEPKAGSQVLFLVLGQKGQTIQIVHVAGELAGRPRR